MCSGLALYCSGVLDLLQERIKARGFCRILEIGAGYGNLAYALTRILGPTDYTIIDLPESLVYSTCYLNVVLPGQAHHVVVPAGQKAEAGPGLTYLANHLLDEFLPSLGQMDLAINVLSLSEMSPEQVDYYARVLGGLLGEEGVFLEQNYFKPGFHTDAKSILSQYFPYHRRLEETVAPHTGRGEVGIWANRYIGEVFNSSDILAWKQLFSSPAT